MIRDISELKVVLTVYYKVHVLFHIDSLCTCTSTGIICVSVVLKICTEG